METPSPNLPDGLVVIAKRDCPTCTMVEPLLGELARSGAPLTVVSQDDPSFPAGVPNILDDRELERSYRLNIEIVPTIIRVEGGREVERHLGWNREEWRQITGHSNLGQDLPENRPGCGSKTLEPGIAEKLAVKFGEEALGARKIELAPMEDEMEACFERGWSDGLPVVPPTPERVMAMLEGTKRDPQEMIGNIPPEISPCTVEKVAINAVMAGCKPEYLPVVLAAVEAALIDEFCMHGLLCTTYFSGPMVIVNGPVRNRIAINSGMNVLGQGNRANSTIGRALQLVIRNVGGGRPGGIDRAALGNPGKAGWCFAEDEEGSPWESLADERGVAEGKSAVTLFAADGVQGIVDQKSREPESLARSFARALEVVCHPKLVMGADAFLVISPEHARVFRDAQWSKAQLKTRLLELLTRPGKDLVQGAGGIDEGLPAKFADLEAVPKFRDGGLSIVHAGGRAGMFSAVIAGWGASGEIGSVPVTKEIGE